MKLYHIENYTLSFGDKVVSATTILADCAKVESGRLAFYKSNGWFRSPILVSSFHAGNWLNFREIEQKPDEIAEFAHISIEDQGSNEGTAVSSLEAVEELLIGVLKEDGYLQS